MGMGIGMTAALYGKKNVIIMDTNSDGLNKSFDFAKKWFNNQVKKDKITQDESNDTISRISITDSVDSLKACDFVIEAATENESIKKSIFLSLDSICDEDVILSSNTSSIPITKMAGWLSFENSRRDKICGMHFMNPVPVMKLCEIIPSYLTSNETKDIVCNLAVDGFGKQISVSRDDPGFIANRILMPYINEAIYCLQDGIASKEDIDKTMKFGTNVPMGPLELADFIGLDTCLFIQETLFNGLGDNKYRPCPLLQRYVEAGLLGKKSGKGFYDYTK